jgi:hypothetical protein
MGDVERHTVRAHHGADAADVESTRGRYALVLSSVHLMSRRRIARRKPMPRQFVVTCWQFHDDVVNYGYVAGLAGEPASQGDVAK